MKIVAIQLATADIHALCGTLSMAGRYRRFNDLESILGLFAYRPHTIHESSKMRCRALRPWLPNMGEINNSPMLIDEFEPDDNARNGSRQDSVLALFRRMSGGGGGRISRGGADHSSVSFRTLGAAYVTSINHIHLEPQDRSRFVMLQLGSLPNTENASDAAERLAVLEQNALTLSPKFLKRMLACSGRWDKTHAAISAEVRRLGFDARQASTAATIAAGHDIAFYDEEIDPDRLRDLKPLLLELLDEPEDSTVEAEGQEALNHLLGSKLQLDHGIRRTVGELVESIIADQPVHEVSDPMKALAREGIHVLSEKEQIALRTGKTDQLAQLYADTKWRNGTHVSALLKLEGVTRPKNPVRINANSKQRVILVPFSCLHFCSNDVR